MTFENDIAHALLDTADEDAVLSLDPTAIDLTLSQVIDIEAAVIGYRFNEALALDYLLLEALIDLAEETLRKSCDDRRRIVSFRRTEVVLCDEYFHALISKGIVDAQRGIAYTIPQELEGLSR